MNAERAPEAINSERVKDIETMSHQVVSILREYVQEEHFHQLYHDLGHTEGVQELVNKFTPLLDVLEIVADERVLLLAALAVAVAGHDSIIEIGFDRKEHMIKRDRAWTAPWPDGKTTPVGNEIRSFETTMLLALQTISPGEDRETEGELVDRHQQMMRSDVTYKKFAHYVEDAIRATYPIAVFSDFPANTNFIVSDGQSSLDIRPFLKPGSESGAYTCFRMDQPYVRKAPEEGGAPLSIAGFIMSSSDLGVAGLSENSDAVILSGYEEFLELKNEVNEDLADIQNVTPERAQEIINTFLDWSDSQVGFWFGRKQITMKNIEEHPVFTAIDNDDKRAEAQQTARGLFKYFDTNIIALANRATALREKWKNVAVSNENVGDVLKGVIADLRIEEERIQRYAAKTKGDAAA